MARKATDTINIRVRMPEGLRKKLAGEADRSQRSLNSEIVWRLGQSLGADDLVQEHESNEERTKRILEEVVAKLIAERKA